MTTLSSSFLSPPFLAGIGESFLLLSSPSFPIGTGESVVKLNRFSLSLRLKFVKRRLGWYKRTSVISIRTGFGEDPRLTPETFRGGK